MDGLKAAQVFIHDSGTRRNLVGAAEKLGMSRAMVTGIYLKWNNGLGRVANRTTRR
ncbi:hypothetical protein [Providencia hangzhouensis]|uniref:hypothetical protein n=1 Tax=Providencia hangzhouensis TaxID=3031799 RepID=UPI0034DD4C00